MDDFMFDKKKGLGEDFVYKQTPQGQMSEAKSEKKGSGEGKKDFDIHQNFSDVPVMGVDAAKKGTGAGKDEKSKLFGMADNRTYMVDAGKKANAGK